MPRKLRKHPSINLSEEDYDTPNFFRTFNTALQLPKRDLPESIKAYDADFMMCGYTLLFDNSIDSKKLFELCKKREWKQLMNIAGDFWLLCVDLSTKEIFVVTDSVSKFSTFFYVSDKEIKISTSFAEVLSIVASPKIDINACFNFISNTRFLAMDENTPVKQIKTLPPGSLLSIEPNFKWKVKSLIDLDDFFSVKIKAYSSMDQYLNEFLEVFAKYTKDRINVVKKFNLASDISSGFDSSLLSYILSEIIPGGFEAYCWKSSSIDARDTNPEVVKRFSNKHNIDLNFFGVDNMYSFSDFDISWTAKNLYPGNHSAKVVHDYNLAIAKRNITALFQGHGGDEIYSGPFIENELRFFIQKSYFLLKNGMEMGNSDELLFTKFGYEFLLDENRFKNHGYFPPKASTSTSYLYPALFSIYWETNVWPITPFTDPRLVLFSRSMPITKVDTSSSKRKMWLNRKDIFLDEQFIKGWHMDSLFTNFIVERQKLLLPILENSVLSNLGYFRGKEIARDLRSGRTKTYLNEGINGILDNFLHLEYFLQSNNITS